MAWQGTEAINSSPEKTNFSTPEMTNCSSSERTNCSSPERTNCLTSERAPINKPPSEFEIINYLILTIHEGALLLKVYLDSKKISVFEL